MPEKWIQKAIKKKGALRQYVRRKYGNRAFTKKGTIKVGILKKLLKDKSVSETTKRRVRLALTLRKLRRKKR